MFFNNSDGLGIAFVLSLGLLSSALSFGSMTAPQALEYAKATFQGRVEYNLALFEDLCTDSLSPAEKHQLLKDLSGNTLKIPLAQFCDSIQGDIENYKRRVKIADGKTLTPFDEASPGEKETKATHLFRGFLNSESFRSHLENEITHSLVRTYFDVLHDQKAEDLRHKNYLKALKEQRTTLVDLHYNSESELDESNYRRLVLKRLKSFLPSWWSSVESTIVYQDTGTGLGARVSGFEAEIKELHRIYKQIIENPGLSQFIIDHPDKLESDRVITEDIIYLTNIIFNPTTISTSSDDEKNQLYAFEIPFRLYPVLKVLNPRLKELRERIDAHKRHKKNPHPKKSAKSKNRSSVNKDKEDERKEETEAVAAVEEESLAATKEEASGEVTDKHPIQESLPVQSAAGGAGSERPVTPRPESISPSSQISTDNEGRDTEKNEDKVFLSIRFLGTETKKEDALKQLRELRVEDDLRLLFDSIRSEGAFRFQEIRTLTQRLGGVIQFNEGGSSHCRITFPGSVSFAFIPHGRGKEEKLRGRSLALFRHAFIKAGISRETLPELFDK